MTFTGTYDGSKNPKSGIFFQCYESKIINNIITGVGSGTTALHILDWSYWVDDLVKGKNLIEGNTFTNCGCGIGLTPTLRPGYNSRIVNNNFIGNKENANFVILLPSIVDIFKNNVKRLIHLADTTITDDLLGFGLTMNYWDGNYWDDCDTVFKIIPGTLQSPGLINQLFHYVFPWIGFDWNPASEPYDKVGVNEEYYMSSYEDPLSFRVEFKKIFDRVWKINGYATNTLDEHITVRWGCSPCVFAFFYPVPDEDLNLLVGQYRSQFYSLKYYNKWFDFEPGEEKLIDSKLFYGVSNHFTYGLSKGHHHYIDSWPILPNGDYEVRTSLSPYQNVNYEMLSLGVQETYFFNYS
jgi:hypothetical protein